MQTPDVSRAIWRKSTRSNGAGGNCVEVARILGHVAIRDSRAPEAGHPTLPAATFAQLISRAKRDGFTT